MFCLCFVLSAASWHLLGMSFPWAGTMSPDGSGASQHGPDHAGHDTYIRIICLVQRFMRCTRLHMLPVDGSVDAIVHCIHLAALQVPLADLVLRIDELDISCVPAIFEEEPERPEDIVYDIMDGDLTFKFCAIGDT